MKKVISIKNMQEADNFTIANYVDDKTLMYKAGEGVFNSVNFYGHIGVVVGKGNNGGDGYVLSKILKENNYDVEILKIEEPTSDAAKYYYEKCKELKIINNIVDACTDFNNYDILVDAIYGTGFKGKLKNNIKDIINRINNSNAYIVSIDINSGMNGDNGLCDEAIKSDETIAIQHLKPGLLLNKAKDYIKDLKCVDIGIKDINETYSLIEQEDIKKIFERKNLSNKGTYGYVALIGGSTNYSGAIKLANMACLCTRCGSGVVKLAVIKDIKEACMPYLLESTLFELSSDNYNYIFNEEEIKELVSNTKSVCLGMGLKSSKEVEKLIIYLVNSFNGTLIIDADGLNTLAKMNLEILNDAKCKIVLTPHIKEFSRLINKDISEINDDPIKYTKDFAKKYNVTLLLKGPCTIVSNGEKVYLVNKGCPGMATAGSGDVLSGIITSILGYCNDTLLGVSAGAYINGLAGEIAQGKSSSVTMISSDTIANIKTAIEKIIKE